MNKLTIFRDKKSEEKLRRIETFLQTPEGVIEQLLKENRKMFHYIAEHSPVLLEFSTVVYHYAKSQEKFLIELARITDTPFDAELIVEPLDRHGRITHEDVYTYLSSDHNMKNFVKHCSFFVLSKLHDTIIRSHRQIISANSKQNGEYE
jgi:hypothetical protein